jgi:hypothetical protein
MRQSAKEKNVQQAETVLLNDHYIESQATAVMLAENTQLISGTQQLPIKYIPRKPLR